MAWFLFGALIMAAIIVKWVQGLHCLDRPTPRPVDDIERHVQDWDKATRFGERYSTNHPSLRPPTKLTEAEAWRLVEEYRAMHPGGISMIYRCNVCGYDADTKGELVAHMRDKHPLSTINDPRKGPPPQHRGPAL